MASSDQPSSRTNDTSVPTAEAHSREDARLTETSQAQGQADLHGYETCVECGSPRKGVHADFCSRHGAASRQVGGDHYKNLNVQPIDFIEGNNLGWCEGNAIKYITRHHLKGGEQDIDKAIHYLQLLKERTYGRRKD